MEHVELQKSFLGWRFFLRTLGANNRHITSLQLPNLGLRDEDISAFSECALRIVDISGSADVTDLTHIVAPSLRDLNVGGCSGIETFARLARATRLKELDAKNTCMVDVDTAHIAGTLKYLDVTGTGVTGAGLMVIGANCRLETCIAHGQSFSSASLQILLNPDMRFLECTHGSDNADPMTLKALATIGRKAPNVLAVELRILLPDHAAFVPVFVDNCRVLTRLNLSGSRLPEDIVAHLLRLPRLKELDLPETGLAVMGFLPDFPPLMCPTLEILDVSNNRVGFDDAVLASVRAVCPSLSSINISGNSVTPVLLWQIFAHTCPWGL